MDEFWKVFPLDHRFHISSHGRVRGRRRILSLQFDKDGYTVFAAWASEEVPMDGRKCKVHKVHRAVYQTFVGSIPEELVINHKNGVKHDNRVDNLEAVTPAENVIHSFRELGRKGMNTNPCKGEDHHNCKLTSDQVREIRSLYAQGVKQKDLALMFSTPQPNISSIVLRKAWSHV